MQLYTYVEIIKDFIALIFLILFGLTLPVLIIKEHLKNNRHEYYKTHYDTQKDIQYKIEEEQAKTKKLLSKESKRLGKIKYGNKKN